MKLAYIGEKYTLPSYLKGECLAWLLNGELGSHKVLILSDPESLSDDLFCDTDIFTHREMLLTILFIS